MEKVEYYAWFGVTTHGRQECSRDINTSMVLGLDSKILFRIEGFWIYCALQYVQNRVVRQDPQHEELKSACIAQSSAFSD